MKHERLSVKAALGISLLGLGSTLGFLFCFQLLEPISGDDLLANQPKTEYARRRQALMQKMRDGVILIIGAREEDFGEVARFRQSNYFAYLTGVKTPGAYLLLVPEGLIPGKRAAETLFIPSRSLFRERWTGPQIGPGSEAERLFGVEEVTDAGKFTDRLREVLNAAFKSGKSARTPKLYTIIPSGPAGELTRESRFAEKLRANLADVQIINVSPVIDEMRRIKSPAEVALIQRAIDITIEAHREAARAIKPGGFEYEVQGALEAVFARRGAERPGFPSIVGAGFNSTVLHTMENRGRIEAGDLVVVDVGAEFSFYSADITRTYPASGKFTSRQLDIYKLVLRAQQAAEQAFKPGQSSVGQLHNVAAQVMKNSPLRDKHGQTLDRYFIHGLSHWLGMDVHDVGSYSDLPIGSVFTIEPGIYLPDEKLGVRIEDDYLVTETGLVKLSLPLPSEPDEIERLMTASQLPITAPRLSDR